ncbi:MAG: hypothetical protein KC468_05780, partial [Myxococcales bacterium]|nr:hypothetical protein [Myxococcales bacterium]
LIRVFVPESDRAQAEEILATPASFPDDPDDPDTRRYIETVGYTGVDGKVRLDVPPDTDWLVYISRRPEYRARARARRVGAGRIELVVHGVVVERSGPGRRAVAARPL